MTLENVKALSDSEIAEVIAWGQAELKERAERRKQETIAKIKELAGSVGVRVAVGPRSKSTRARTEKAGR